MTLKPQNLDIALMTKQKPFRGKASVGHKGGVTPQRRRPQNMSSSKSDSGTKCFYCGRVGHIARNCHKLKLAEGRHRYTKHAGCNLLMNIRTRISDFSYMILLSLLRMMKQKLGLWNQELPLT